MNNDERISELYRMIRKCREMNINVPRGVLVELGELSLEKEMGKDLVVKTAKFHHELPEFSEGKKYITFEFPICAIDIKPPMYKIKK